MGPHSSEEAAWKRFALEVYIDIFTAGTGTVKGAKAKLTLKWGEVSPGF